MEQISFVYRMMYVLFDDGVLDTIEAFSPELPARYVMAELRFCVLVHSGRLHISCIYVHRIPCPVIQKLYLFDHQDRYLFPNRRYCGDKGKVHFLQGYGKIDFPRIGRIALVRATR